MSQVIADRVSADIQGDFVVFLIGMRINKPWKVHKWLPVVMAMPGMLKELATDKSVGCLGVTTGFPVIVQYWRSFEQLEAYARDREGRHFKAWSNFNRQLGKARGDVGIWHETYKVRAGEYENIYSGMPPFGLGKAGLLSPSTHHRTSARGRLTGVA
jgi:hypothetical protein